MGYTVAHQGETQERGYRDYLRLLSRMLLQRGVHLDKVPRTPANGRTDRWLYVWDDEAEARAFAEQIKKETEDPQWQVCPVAAAPSIGPLRPIEVVVGREADSWTFGLDPVTRRALQARFPGSCENDDVSIGVPFGVRGKASWTKTAAGVRVVVRQVLPVLTGLSEEQLRAFGAFEVVDPVSLEVLVPPAPV
jgi:hypothetical protein